MSPIDLNADLGEGCPNDSLIIPLITSANISCGAHAGDSIAIHKAIEAALSSNVAIGAHPGYEDPKNFGRIPLHLSENQLRKTIEKQLTSFLEIAAKFGANVHHVKPHGALYNQANQDPSIASILIQTIASILPETKLYCPPSGKLSIAANVHNLIPIPEAFADRRYLSDSTLMPRNHSNAIIHDLQEATEQALRIAKSKQVTVSNITIPLPAKTICVHGDTPQAFLLIESIRKTFLANQIPIQAP